MRLIFDTDICGDCDDVLALGMIHALQSRGHCRLLAVTISVDNEQAAPFVDAVNTFYGRGDIPIGVVGKGGVVEKSAFLSLVEEKDADGDYRYPHDLLSGRSAPGATAVLRKTLAAQPDRSVVDRAGRVLDQPGAAARLARRTSIRRCPAPELVRRKVKLLSLMAGAFHDDRGQQPLPGIQRHQGHQECPGARRALADPDGLQRVRDRHRPAVPGDQHRARLRLRPASPAGRSLHPPQPAAAQPADLGPHQRAVRRPRRSRLLRPLAAREGDGRGRRLHAVRGDLRRETVAT